MRDAGPLGPGEPCSHANLGQLHCIDAVSQHEDPNALQILTVPTVPGPPGYKHQFRKVCRACCWSPFAANQPPSVGQLMPATFASAHLYM